MAAEAPAAPKAWVNDDPDSAETGIVDTRSLEIGMTAMGLVATLQEEPAPDRKETGSTVSTSAAPEEDNLHQADAAQTADVCSGSKVGSAPPSPSSEKQMGAASKLQQQPQQQQQQAPSRPPGLGGQQHNNNNNLPSPIVKPGHSKNSSATSPLLTLTPNSSVDGNLEWAGRHPSPCPSAGGGEGGAGGGGSSASTATAPPSMPYLSTTDNHRRLQHQSDGIETSSFGSFELGENSDNDGLLGLEALRERARTAPAPPASYSTSPPVGRGYFPSSSHGEDRPRRADRPPLSHHSAYAQEGSASSYAGDRSVGERSTGSLGLPTTTASYQPNNVSLDSGDGRTGFGAIARPELRQSATEFDPSRRRSFSSDNFQQQQQYLQQQQQQQSASLQQEQGQISQKFAALTTLGSHLQHQRVHGPQEGYGDLQKPRHIRSASQPMQGQHSALGNLQMDPRSFGSSAAGGQYDSSTFGKSAGGGLYRATSSSHTGSASHQGISGTYESSGGQYGNQKRASVPNYTGNPYSQAHSSLQRRDALDFQLSPHDQQRHGGGGASAEEARIFGGAPSMISPGQSPLQSHYGGGHSRNHSDTTSGILSSSPMSMSSGVLRGQNQPPSHVHHASMGGIDDDALIGENIEVPADHFGGSNQGFGLNQSASMPMMRSPHHSHSVSFDQLPTLYQDAQHHLPTAGSALPLPKVVYIVKFKQTQRNFVLGPRITRDLKIGTYVKVEADRGEDLGIVVGRVPADKYNFANRNQYTAGMGPPQGSLGSAGAADLKRIIRLATHDEVSLLGMKREEEEELLKICRGKVRQRGLPMNVVDAEYQFDRHKLTFFFEAEGRVDFRELVRDLFSMYKTRIWMQQLDKNTSSSTPAIVAPQAANLQMDYGTPIIAPPSEFADSVVLNGMGDPR